VLAGRAIADAALMVLVALVTLLVGVGIGFRPSTSIPEAVLALAVLAAAALCFAIVFVFIGLASGNAQAAQGLSILAVPFSFISSAFVPIATMPGPVQAFAKAQPLTYMVDAWRGLLLGDAATRTFDHEVAYYVFGSLVWALVVALVFTPLAMRAYRRG
jgi:ABC-2 type transport system permease protein/oleandomycin transport system permease protein